MKNITLLLIATALAGCLADEQSQSLILGPCEQVLRDLEAAGDPIQPTYYF